MAWNRGRVIQSRGRILGRDLGEEPQGRILPGHPGRRITAPVGEREGKNGGQTARLRGKGGVWIMAKEGSFIKLDRKILQWGWYTNVCTKTLFLHCLLMANWKPGEFQGVRCERGQLITSLESLSRQTGLTVRQVRTALKHLETTGEVTKRATSKFTLLTVNRYDYYQGDGSFSGRRETKERQGTGKQTTTIKERKEEKETKEGPAYPDGEDVPSGDGYMEDYYKHRGA